MPSLPLIGVPGALLRLAERHGSSAVANVSAAATAVSSAVRDRADLTHSLLQESDSPGTLSLLPADTCWELLASRTVGRLAYIARRGVPDIVPVNYLLLDGDVLIRSGPGPKLQAAEREELVAFEVDDLDEDGRSGWSVVVHGRASRVRWEEQLRLPGVGAPWASGPREQLIRIRTRRVSGRRIVGTAAYDGGPSTRPS